jgi:acyl carrier protein
METREKTSMTDPLFGEITEFLKTNFVFTDEEIPSDASLTGAGVIDSMGILEVVLFLEENFGIVVEDDDVVAENLDSINGLVAYVQRKAARAA